MPLPCLVLGGGRGTRMRPATDSVPKPLLPVAGVPFVVHQLRRLASQGVTDVVYSIGYRGDMIKQYFAQYASTAGDIAYAVRVALAGIERAPEQFPLALDDISD